jgi:hypothetical protein
MKKMIRDSYEVDWEGSRASYVVEILNNYIAKYQDVRIEYKYFGYDGAFDVAISFEREETDKEYEARLVKEKVKEEKLKNRAAKKKQKEYEQYLKLKDKFENE